MTFVVATAGHVDHGKSTLVRALTGMEPDRLAAERQRGLSIELGYAWTTWPPVGDVAFVDVPGHRRFIRTTLAGLGPVPVVLLVVAADEGWMPQSAEHLTALDALGVSHGVLVITKTDRTDPTRASHEARRALEPTTLADVPEVRVCAPVGTGMRALVGALTGVLDGLPAPDPTAPTRLWVDRSFTVAGAGQVITGTLPAGTIRVGDELVSAAGALVRVRGIESLGRPVDETRGTARVALNLRIPGGSRRGAEVARGEALFAPGTHTVTTVVDGALRGVIGRPDATAVAHVGTAAVGCRVRPLGDEHVRLALVQPLPLRVGDLVLVRDPGRLGAVAGITVLDVRPPALAGRGAAGRRATLLADVRTPRDAVRVLLAAGPERIADLRAMGLPTDAGIRVARHWRVGTERWAALGTELNRLRADDAARDPLGRPRTAGAVADALGLPDAALSDALAASAAPATDHAESLPSDLMAALDRLDEWYAEHPYAAPPVDQLNALGLDEAALATAARAGRLLRLAPRVVLPAGADAAAAERLTALPSPFRVTDACVALAATRRTVVPLLEHLDRRGSTRQVGSSARVVVAK